MQAQCSNVQKLDVLSLDCDRAMAWQYEFRQRISFL